MKGQNYKAFFAAKEEEPQEQVIAIKGVGRISNQLTGAVIYKRSPEFFDTEEIRLRDKKLAEETQKLIENDALINLTRNDKPVSLSPLQHRIIAALSYALSQYMEDGDIKQIIEAPYLDTPIVRTISTGAFCKLIFGSSKKQHKDKLREELEKIASIKQALPLKWTDKKGRDREAVYIQSLIMIPGEIIDISKDIDEESEERIDLMRIQFSRIFFLDLKKRYSPITLKTFELWRRGKKPELWSILLFSIIHARGTCLTAARKSEGKIREEQEQLPRGKRLSPQELQERVNAAKAEAMKYTLLFSSIKERAATDYESTPYYRFRFSKDLKEAIKDFKEVDLVKDADIVDGRTEKKVIFYLSETYSDLSKQESKLLAPPEDIP